MRWAIWWFAVLCAYLIAAQAEVGTEAVAGAVISAFAVAIAARAFTSAPSDVRMPWRSLRRYGGLPARMVQDAFRVSASIVSALMRGEQPAGYFTRIPFTPAQEEDSMDQGREGLVAYGLCAAPNTMVADVDDRGSIVLHELTSRPVQMESPEWPL